MNATILHHYRIARAHQLATYTPTLIVFPDGEKVNEWTGGGAAYQHHAYAALMSAKRTIHFRKTLAADLKARKKKSITARKRRKVNA